MRDWGRRLMDGLLTGGRDASLEGWPPSRRIRIGLFAPNCQGLANWKDSVLPFSRNQGRSDLMLLATVMVLTLRAPTLFLVC
eukprot:1150879-Pelagomonas_calceolata.AAC.1